MKRTISFLGIIFIIGIVCSICYADSLLVNEYFSSPATGSVTTRYGALASGVYTSKIQDVGGTPRIKGVIFIDSGAPPTSCYINESVGGTSTTKWHGTDTVAFVSVGGLWRGEIDFPNFYKFAKLTISGIAASTFLSINWYTTLSSGRDIAVRWADTTTVVGTSTLQLTDTISSRKYIRIANDGTDNDLYISGNTPIGAGAGIFIAKKGSSTSYWEDTTGKFLGIIYGITSAGTTTVRITELQ